MASAARSPQERAPLALAMAYGLDTPGAVAAESALAWLGPLAPVPINGRCAPPAEAITRHGVDWGVMIRQFTTVSELAEEYFAPGGTRDVELRWGEGKPHVPAGHSWRGALTRGPGATSLTSLFSQMREM